MLFGGGRYTAQQVHRLPPLCSRKQGRSSSSRLSARLCLWQVAEQQQQQLRPHQAWLLMLSGLHHALKQALRQGGCRRSATGSRRCCWRRCSILRCVIVDVAHAALAGGMCRDNHLCMLACVVMIVCAYVRVVCVCVCVCYCMRL